MADADTDQQPAPAPPPPLPAGVDPDMLRNALAYLNQTPPPVTVDQTPVDTSGFGGKFRNVIGILGNALGGGGNEGIPQSPTQKEDAGIRALMRFSTGLMAASHYVPGQTVFSNLAQGFQGAADSEQDSQRTSAALLGARQQYQEQQQQQAIERIKTALPLLQQQQLQAAKNAALGVGNTPAPGSSISTGGSIGQVNVPPELLPIYQAASARTGIPADVLIAQTKQESGFNPNATGAAGEIGMAQVMPSTAKSPGFGMAPVDPKALRDPATAINFQADYLKAHLPKGADPTDPVAIAAALKGYNGGGDPNYVANVNRYLPGARAAIAPPAPIPGQTPPPVAGAPSPAGARPVLPAPQPPVAATGNQFGGPGAPTNGVIPPSPPGSAADVATIRSGMVGAGANPTTLAPGQGSAPAPQGATVVAGAPQAAPPPPLTPQPTTPPTPGRVPSTFTPQPVPLRPDIQARIDNPLPPDQLQRLNTAISTAQTPEALQAAQKARDDAVATARAAALSQGEAYQTQAVNIQKEVWKARFDAQNQEDAAVAADARKNAQEERMAGINNVNTQVNAQRSDLFKRDNDRLDTYDTDAANAQNTLNILQVLQGQEKSMPASGSLLLARNPAMFSILPNLGLSADQAAGLSGQELFSRTMSFLGAQLSEQASRGPGTARNAEISQNMSGLPDLATDHEGRVQTMGMLSNIAHDVINRDTAARQYYNTTPHPNPVMAKTGLTTLDGFGQWYDQNGPQFIPRIAPGMSAADQAKIVKPGMLYEQPQYQMVPGTNTVARDASGQPVITYQRKVRE